MAPIQALANRDRLSYSFCMLIILAPSKTLDFQQPAPSWVTPTSPQFKTDAAAIVKKLATMDQAQLARLMHVSEAIAKTNHDRMQHWGEVTKAALWAYRGDVYKGMYADELTPQDATWAQKHLVIMSGLYGCVRPFDEISPYRLEMKAKLSVDGKKDLYDLWGTRLSEYADARSGGIICNLASDEYGRPVTRYSRSRIVTPVFIDHRPGGKIGPAPIYNKMMRGVLAHWMIKHAIETPEGLRNFAGHGYSYDESRSTDDAPAFTRPKMKPLVF